MTTDQTLPYAPPPRRPRLNVREDIAYILPMGIFLAFTQLGSSYHNLFPLSYVLKTFLTAIALWLCWHAYTKIRWTHLTLGAIVGVVGLFQWVYFDKAVNHFFTWAHAHGSFLDWVPVYGKIGASGVPTDNFNPFETFPSPLIAWTFIAIRWGCAALVVPVMEELFWRDFLWRTIAAPADFKIAAVGERDRNAFVLVALVFATVHIQWITAIVWGLLIAWLLVRTKSLGACIVAHGVTNFLLGLYVLYTKDWYYW
jgi:CAAX prenyl protease-like protein